MIGNRDSQHESPSFSTIEELLYSCDWLMTPDYGGPWRELLGSSSSSIGVYHLFNGFFQYPYPLFEDSYLFVFSEAILSSEGNRRVEKTAWAQPLTPSKSPVYGMLQNSIVFCNGLRIREQMQQVHVNKLLSLMDPILPRFSYSFFSILYSVCRPGLKRDLSQRIIVASTENMSEQACLFVRIVSAKRFYLSLIFNIRVCYLSCLFVHFSICICTVDKSRAHVQYSP